MSSDAVTVVDPTAIDPSIARPDPRATSVRGSARTDTAIGLSLGGVATVAVAVLIARHRPGWT